MALLPNTYSTMSSTKAMNESNSMSRLLVKMLKRIRELTVPCFRRSFILNFSLEIL